MVHYSSKDQKKIKSLPGKPYRYFYKAYALDTTLSLKVGATKSQLELAMSHIPAQGEIVGKCGR